MARQSIDLVALGKQIETFLAILPDLERLGDIAKVEDELRKRNNELKSEQNALIKNLKTQARTEVEHECADLIAKAKAQAKQITADAEAKVDEIEREFVRRSNALTKLNADIERSLAKIAEVRRAQAAYAAQLAS